jgi:hypothetical protein
MPRVTHYTTTTLWHNPKTGRQAECERRYRQTADSYWEPGDCEEDDSKHVRVWYEGREITPAWTTAYDRLLELLLEQGKEGDMKRWED